MDPFSLSVGIAGLAGLAATAVSLSKEYLSGVKSSKSSINTLVIELEAIQSNLLSLDKLLRSASSQNLEFQQTSLLRSCTSSCEGKLKSLCEKLRHASASRAGRYLWPFSDKEHQKTVLEFRAFAQWMHFALSVDGCSLLSRTSEDVRGVLVQQLESLKLIEANEKNTTRLQQSVEDQIRILKDDRSARERGLLLDRISKSDHDQKHQSVRLPRVEGTGGWLLERQEYLQWRDDDAVSNVIWCPGVQGSGKSVLT